MDSADGDEGDRIVVLFLSIFRDKSDYALLNASVGDVDKGDLAGIAGQVLQGVLRGFTRAAHPVFGD